MNFYDIRDEDYQIVKDDSKVLIESINFNNDNDKFLCESIIDELEKSIVDTVNEGKIAYIPFIGSICRNKVRQEVIKNFSNFKLARKFLTKEQYKEHVRSVINDAKEQERQEEYKSKFYAKLRKKNKKKYETFYRIHGKAYANMYIYALTLMKEVPFDNEVEEMFARLREK